MKNLFSRIAPYLGAIAISLTPLSAQDGKLVKIAEREIGDKKIEYRASPDIAIHMKFLSGLASVFVDYDLAKPLWNSKYFTKDSGGLKEGVAEICTEATGRDQGLVTEKEILSKFPGIDECEVNGRIGRGLVDIVSLYQGRHKPAKIHQGSRAVEEHVWIAYMEKMIADGKFGDSDEHKTRPVVGLDARLFDFSARADKNKDGVVSTDEYLALRKKFFQKISWRDFSSAIGSGWSNVSPIWKEYVGRNWDLLEGTYLPKLLVEIYQNPKAFAESNFPEEASEVKKLNLQKLDEETQDGFELVMPWINLKTPSLADKTLVYSLGLAGDLDLEALKEESPNRNTSGLSRESNDSPFKEKRVIRQGPIIEQRREVR